MYKVSAPAARVVHIWHVPLALDDPAPESAACLSAAESARASAYIHLPSRARFIGARVALRRILAAYLGVSAEAVPIDTDARGKPHVADAPCFNVSHCADRAVVALALSPVGIDIERVDDRPGLIGIARRFFADPEVRALSVCGPDAFAPAFYGCWTRKESLAKGVGLGLALPLGAFTVSIPPDPARLITSEDERLRADEWTLRDVDAGAGFAGAVAARGPIDDVIAREWTGGPGRHAEGL